MKVNIGQGIGHSHKLPQSLQANQHLPVFAGANIFTVTAIVQERFPPDEVSAWYGIPVSQHLQGLGRVDRWHHTTNAVIVEKPDARVNQHNIRTNAGSLTL